MYERPSVCKHTHTHTQMCLGDARLLQASKDTARRINSGFKFVLLRPIVMSRTQHHNTAAFLEAV